MKPYGTIGIRILYEGREPLLIVQDEILISVSKKKMNSDLITMFTFSEEEVLLKLKKLLVKFWLFKGF